jgi:hypothetical protein
MFALSGDPLARGGRIGRENGAGDFWVAVQYARIHPPMQQKSQADGVCSASAFLTVRESARRK